jgi:hypothetical protein
MSRVTEVKLQLKWSDLEEDSSPFFKGYDVRVGVLDN